MTDPSEIKCEVDDDDEGQYWDVPPDGYECCECGHLQPTPGLAGMCDRCGGPTTEFYA